MDTKINSPKKNNDSNLNIKLDDIVNALKFSVNTLKTPVNSPVNSPKLKKRKLNC
jgi:hypothetical protein